MKRFGYFLFSMILLLSLLAGCQTADEAAGPPEDNGPLLASPAPDAPSDSVSSDADGSSPSSVYEPDTRTKTSFRPLCCDIYTDSRLYTYQAPNDSSSDAAIQQAALELGRLLMEDLCRQDPAQLPNESKWRWLRGEYQITDYRDLRLDILACTDSALFTDLSRGTLGPAAKTLIHSDTVWVVTYDVAITGQTRTDLHMGPPYLTPYHWQKFPDMFYNDFGIIVKEGTLFTLLRSGDIAAD